MRNRIIVILVCCLSAFHPAGGISQEKEFSILKGPYLGQKPPGLTPELFAPGIISSGMNEAFLVFAPDYNEIYYDLTHLTH
jgi:hypothetical protein